MGINDFAEVTILLCLMFFLFHLCKNSTWLKKNTGICFLERVADDSVYTLWAKNFVKITLSYTVSQIKAFCIYIEIQDDHSTKYQHLTPHGF